MKEITKNNLEILEKEVAEQVAEVIRLTMQDNGYSQNSVGLDSYVLNTQDVLPYLNFIDEKNEADIEFFLKTKYVLPISEKYENFEFCIKNFGEFFEKNS